MTGETSGDSGVALYYFAVFPLLRAAGRIDVVAA